MSDWRKTVLIGLAAWLVGSALGQGIVYVNGAAGDDGWDGRSAVWDGGAGGPKATIKAGIDVAVAGDEVVLADGVYCGPRNTDLNFHGKAITVCSEGGDATACIIDCEFRSVGFTFESRETATVRGVTVRNGATAGPCIDIADSNPTFSDCIISGNTGGAIRCILSDAALLRCTFSGNDGIMVCGSSNVQLMNCQISGNTGGLHCWDSTITMADCLFSRNTESSGVRASYGSRVSLADCAIVDTAYTAGLECLDGASVTLTRCTISGTAGASEDSGYGIYCEGGTLTAVDCSISGNKRWGLCVLGGSVTLSDCVISGNGECGVAELVGAEDILTLTRCTIAGHAEAGVRCYGSAELSNCAIVGNKGTGVVYQGSANVVLTNCTIANEGYGVSVISGGATLINCILWGRPGAQVYLRTGSSAAVSYCDVRGGWEGAGNIDLDPGFALERDFHLLPGSPCIDRGTTDVPGGVGAEDLEGLARVVDGQGAGRALIDMGASEFQLSPTIAVSAMAVEFFVLEGAAASRSLGIVNSGPGVLSWTLDSDADWLAAEPACGESAGEVSAVTLTANSGGLTRGTYWGALAIRDPRACNSPRIVPVTLHVGHVLNVPGEYATIQAAIDAAYEGDEVWLADGIYSGDGNIELTFGGKAITVRSASDDPRRCTIDCQGSGRGFCFENGETADAVVRGLWVRDGTSEDGGGGIYCSYSDPTLVNCVITGCAAYYGGGVRCQQGAATVTNCVISGNSAMLGGGVACEQCSPVLTNCVISGNTASGTGGGIWCSRGDPIVRGCTVVGNAGHVNAGGVSCRNGSETTLTDCVVWGNVPLEIFVESGSVTATYCDVRGGWEGIGNIDTEPLFADADGADDDPATWEDNDYRLTAGSPCVDAGDPAFAAGADECDLDGRARLWDGDHDGAARLDMGAYEFGSPGPGDMNCDGHLDAFDIDPFVLALTDTAAYAERFPACDYTLADLNGDGAVNVFDIDAFVRALVGGGGR